MPESYVLYLNRKPIPDSLLKSMQQCSSFQRVPYSALQAHMTPSSYPRPQHTPTHIQKENKSHNLTEVLQLRPPMGIDPEVRTKVLKFCSFLWTQEVAKFLFLTKCSSQSCFVH